MKNIVLLHTTVFEYSNTSAYCVRMENGRLGHITYILVRCTPQGKAGASDVHPMCAVYSVQ